MSSPKFTEPIPDISQRKLPPLPIHKRALPTLPQSKSDFINNKCIEEKKEHYSNPSFDSNPSMSTSHSDPARQWREMNKPKPKKTHKTSRSLRTLFTNIQQKMGGSKTRFDNTKNPYKITGKMHHQKTLSKSKSKWRPGLRFICKKDEELLNALIKFMTKQFNEENILFLRSVNELNNNINRLLINKKDINIIKKEKINIEIVSIYHTYITNNAIKQVNISSECFNNIMQMYQIFKQYSLKEMKSMFNDCVSEIEQLIKTSIMTSFYSSIEFQSIAISRNLFHKPTPNPIIKQHKQIKSKSMGGATHIYDMQMQNFVVTNCYYSDDNKTDNEAIDAQVIFDKHSISHWNENNKYMLSSNGFSEGVHKWHIRIIECNDMRQEFGIVSQLNTNIKMNEYGICETPEFGPRAIYGYNKLTKMNENGVIIGNENHFYYESYNKNNTVRCKKELSQLDMHQTQWKNGDIIKICLNLNKGIVKFYLNDKQVRKTVSIERGVTYYPIILYSEQCKYEVIDCE